MSEVKTLEMPKWGLPMEEDLLARWAIQEGDDSTRRQETCEVETSRIANMLGAPFADTLRRIIAREGETLQVGAVLALVTDASISDAELDKFAASLATVKPAVPDPEAAAPDMAAQAGTKPPSAVSPPSNNPEPPIGQIVIPVSLQSATNVTQVNTTPHALRLSARWGVDLKKVYGSGRGGRISISDLGSATVAVSGRLASPTPPVHPSRVPRSHADDSQVSATPLVHRPAGKLSINLHDYRNSGSHGWVSRDDVLAAALLLDGYPLVSPVQKNAPTPFESIPISGMQRAIASRLRASKQQSLHFRLSVDLDLERLLAFRQEINREVSGVKISASDLLVRTYALALVAVSDVSIQFGGATRSIHRFADTDISVAVTLPDGLITPIVRSADRKSISGISAETHALMTRAKAGTLKPEEFQGGIFNVSSLGMLGIRQFDVVINPPQSTILTIGIDEIQAVVRGGQIVTRHQPTISLSRDHRIADGAAGVAFLQELRRLTETPTLMLIQETSHAR